MRVEAVVVKMMLGVEKFARSEADVRRAFGLQLRESAGQIFAAARDIVNLERERCGAADSLRANLLERAYQAFLASDLFRLRLRLRLRLLLWFRVEKFRKLLVGGFNALL